MSNLSDFISSGKPKLITLLTTGTGTYTPTADMARCFVRLQAGGGGGAATTDGGGGGAMHERMMRVPIAGLAYAVGAGGAATAAGSDSTFGVMTANHGMNGGTTTTLSMGGLLGEMGGSVSATAITASTGGANPGVCGGAGGNAGNAGCQAGFPIPPGTSPYGATPFNALADHGNGKGVSSGGDSFYGKGGTTGNAPAAGNYGAGGGANAAGLGGCIEIWDYGT